MSGQHSTLAEMWASFEAKVIPPEAHSTQRIESKRIFYAAAHGVIGLVGDIAEDSTIEEGAVKIEALLQECHAFGRAIQEGRA